MNWYLKVIQQYADFNGRARRAEYWMFLLINAGIGIGIWVITLLLFKGLGFLSVILYFLYALFALIPSLAVTVRRLHDVNKSGAMIFVSLIPLIGGIWLFVLLVTEGTRGQNDYGPDPKEIDFLNVKPTSNSRNAGQFQERPISQQTPPPINDNYQFANNNAAIKNTNIPKTPPPFNNEQTITDRLAKLNEIHELLKDGVINDDEFKIMKKDILN